MRRIIAGLTLPLVLWTAPLAAQGLGLAVGTLVPQSDMAKGAKSGLVVIPSLEVGGRVALRVEALWANSDLKGVVINNVNGVPVPAGSNVSGTVKVIGGLGSLVLHMGLGPIQPYILGGVGYYERSDAQKPADAAESFGSLTRNSSKLGYHFGAGLELSLIGISAFAEARYHSVDIANETTNFIPIVVGIRF